MIVIMAIRVNILSVNFFYNVIRLPTREPQEYHPAGFPVTGIDFWLEIFGECLRNPHPLPSLSELIDLLLVSFARGFAVRTVRVS